MTISYVKAYFNTTNATRVDQWEQACSDAWSNRTCVIPEVGAGGLDGNDTGKTYFFASMGQTVNQTSADVPGAAASGTATMGLMTMAALMGLVLSVIFPSWHDISL